MRRFLLALAALAALAALPTLAAPPRFVSLTFENDFFAGYDRHYTNGLQAAWLVERESLPVALRDLPPVRWSADPDIVVALGQRIYTPTDLEREVPDPGDRPYAGWLYLLADVRTREGRIIDHVTAGVGVVGPASGARRVQDLAHRVIGQERARGWRTQLGNEATFLLGFERAWTGVARGDFAGRRYDLALRAGGVAGNALTYANAGVVLRWGENLPSDIPTTHISLGPSRDGYRGNPAGFGWYAWVGAEGRVVGRNIFLEGLARERYGHDWQAGLALAWPEARIAFTLVERSAEFEGQRSPDRFGQLALSVAY